MMLGAFSTILYRSPSGTNLRNGCSQPSALSVPPEKLRFEGVGSGGIWPPRISNVRDAHTIIITTITVVTYMIRIASSLDS